MVIQVKINVSLNIILLSRFISKKYKNGRDFLDYHNLSNDEVNKLIARLKEPENRLRFTKALEVISSLFGSVDSSEIVIDEDDLEYIIRAYRGRIDMNRFSVHIRFKDYHHHLIRIDINPNNKHTNPITNDVIYGSHIHIYSNKFDKKDTTAIPIENSDFPIVNTLVDAYNELLEYTNIDH